MPSMSHKLRVYKFLKDREGRSYCAAEIATELGLRTSDVRVYLYRLRKQGMIHEAETVGNVKFYTFLNAPAPVDRGALDEIKSLLGFLNAFFKQHLTHLSKDPAIMTFVQEHGETFGKIEEVLKA